MLRQVRALLVDDSEEDFLATRDLLQAISRGRVQLEWIASYDAALAAMVRQEHDVYLLDYQLGERSGLTLLRAAVEAGCRNPILFLTGRGDDRIDEEAMATGAADYLVKGHADGYALERSIRHALERQRAEEALRASEERFRALVEQSSDAIALLREDGEVTYASQSTARVIGYASGEFRGRNVAELAHPEDRAATLQLLHNCLEQPGQAVSAEFRCRHRSGDWRTLEAVAVNRIREPEVGAIVLNYRDATGRKQLEEALLRSEEQLGEVNKMEAVGRLAGGVGHHFNNLLTVVLGYSDLLLHRDDLDSMARESLHEVRKAGERAAALTMQLLTLSPGQIATGQLLDLNRAVAELEPGLRRLAGPGVRLVMDIEPGSAPILAAPGHLAQLLTNLVQNASEAMPEGGHLQVETRSVEAHAAARHAHAGTLASRYTVLTVADTGRGMDAETVARLFEPFFTTKEPGRGAGLGMATVYGIVQRCGGDIEVESAPRRGTTVRVYLPHAGDSDEPVPAPHSAVTEGPTVLLVEDEALVRRLVRNVLQVNGFSILEARQGEEALELSAEHDAPIDLLLPAVMLPGLSGRDLADCLAARHPRCRVLYTSGCPLAGLRQRDLLPDDAPFLQKPFTPELLLRAVCQALAAEPAGIATAA